VTPHLFEIHTHFLVQAQSITHPGIALPRFCQGKTREDPSQHREGKRKRGGWGERAQGGAEPSKEQRDFLFLTHAMKG